MELTCYVPGTLHQTISINFEGAQLMRQETY